MNILAFVNNALMQINFNGTNFINARLTQRVFSVWPVALPVVGEIEMHTVANLATLQIPLATFSPFTKAPKLSENSRYCGASARSYFPLPARTHTYLSLSLSLCASARFSARQAAEEQHFQLNTDIMLLL